MEGTNCTNGEGNGNPLQYSSLENPMDMVRGAWQAAVYGVRKSRTQLLDFTFTFHFHALEKEMAAHSSILAWRIPGMGEPGGLPSRGSHRVGDDWRDLAAAAALETMKKLWGHLGYSELKKYGNVWRGPQTHEERMSGILGAELLKT